MRRRHTRIEKATAALNSSKYSLSRSLDRLECTFWCFGARCPGGTRKLTQAQYRATNIKQSTTQITPYVYAMGTLGLQCDVATKFRALKDWPAPPSLIIEARPGIPKNACPEGPGTGGRYCKKSWLCSAGEDDRFGKVAYTTEKDHQPMDP